MKWKRCCLIDSNHIANEKKWKKCVGNCVIKERGWKHWKTFSILHYIFLKAEVTHWTLTAKTQGQECVEVLVAFQHIMHSPSSGRKKWEEWGRHILAHQTAIKIMPTEGVTPSASFTQKVVGECCPFWNIGARSLQVTTKIWKWNCDMTTVSYRFEGDNKLQL
jgi:hypothetical protein